MSGMLACLLRHFRASLASLPLLSQPIGSLPLGTWAPDTPQGRAALAEVGIYLVASCSLASLVAWSSLCTP